MKTDQLLPRRHFIGALGTAGAAGFFSGVAPWTAVNSTQPQQPLSDYLLAPGITYLNTASLGLTPRTVLERTLAAWYQLESNPVRMAYGDGDVHKASDLVREQLANLMGCTANELLLTRSTTDAMNCLAHGIRFTRGDRILVTDHEHEGGTFCWQHVARHQGLAVDVVSIPMNEHDPARIVQLITEAITPKTRVLSVSHVFTSNGLRLPVNDIAALARTRGILSVVDGAQALGQFDVNVNKIGCDAYAASGHKWLMGPKGTGVLYIRGDATHRIAPVQCEDGNRFVSNSTGIGALPIVIGMGAAIERLHAHGMATREQRIKQLRQRVFDGLKKIPHVHIMSPETGLGATALVACKFPSTVDVQIFHPMLRNKYGLMVKRVEARFFNGIRLSPHDFNTEADIDFALHAIKTELTALPVG